MLAVRTSDEDGKRRTTQKQILQLSSLQNRIKSVKVVVVSKDELLEVRAA